MGRHIDYTGDGYADQGLVDPYAAQPTVDPPTGPVAAALGPGAAMSASLAPMDGYTTARPTLFGREPAMLLNIITAVIALASSTFLHLSIDQQGAVNTVAALLLGLVIAIKVRGGTWVAALLALAQALAAAALAWNFELDPDLQSGIMVLIAAVGGFATRSVVWAPQPPAMPGSSAVA